MSDWKIGLTPTVAKGTPVILGVLTAQMAWKRLSKTAQEAVAVAYLGQKQCVDAHPLTIRALDRHGFVIALAWSSRLGVLTDAGKAVARWCVTK